MPTAEAVPVCTTPPVGAGVFTMAVVGVMVLKFQSVMSVSAVRTVRVAALLVAVETALTPLRFFALECRHFEPPRPNRPPGLGRKGDRNPVPSKFHGIRSPAGQFAGSARVLPGLTPHFRLPKNHACRLIAPAGPSEGDLRGSRAAG